MKKFKKTNCYRVDLHYFDDGDVNSLTGFSHEITYEDVIIPCDVLDLVVQSEIDSCDIIIKEKTFIYLLNEC